MHYVVGEALPDDDFYFSLFSDGGGPELHIGSIEANDTWRENIEVNYQDPNPGSGEPVIFVQSQTNTGPQPVVPRIRNVQRTKPLKDWVPFDVRLQEEEGNDGSHATGDVGFLAIEKGTHETPGRKVEVDKTPQEVTAGWYEIDFTLNFSKPWFLADMQTFNGPDPTGIRYRNLTGSGVEVFIEEEQSADSETGHSAAESVGYIVVDS